MKIELPCDILKLLKNEYKDRISELNQTNRNSSKDNGEFNSMIKAENYPLPIQDISQMDISINFFHDNSSGKRSPLGVAYIPQFQGDANESSIRS